MSGSNKFDMGFDLKGRPLPDSPGAVRRRITAALGDPESEVLLAVLTHRGDVLVQVMGEPSRVTLEILEQAVTAYRRILKGQ